MISWSKTAKLYISQKPQPGPKPGQAKPNFWLLARLTISSSPSHLKPGQNRGFQAKPEPAHHQWWLYHSQHQKDLSLPKELPSGYSSHCSWFHWACRKVRKAWSDKMVIDNSDKGFGECQQRLRACKLFQCTWRILVCHRQRLWDGCGEPICSPRYSCSDPATGKSICVEIRVAWLTWAADAKNWAQITEKQKYICLTYWAHKANG